MLGSVESMKQEFIVRAILSTLFTLFIIGAAIGFFYLELSGLFDFSCPFYVTFGIQCPGCGITRMLKSIKHFDFYQAFRWHNFVFITIPYIVYLYIKCVVCYIKTGTLEKTLIVKVIKYFAAYMIYDIIRNIPIFNWLKPTKAH